MPLLEPFPVKILAFIRRHRLIAAGQHVLAAISGGADSTALLHVLCALRPHLGCRVTVLHFDHRLRGEASTEDRLFVEKLSRDLGLDFYSASGDIPAYRREERGASLEMAARALRHRFFREAMARLEGNWLALGHTANDQAEEVLLRLLRGAGPAGLAGMLPQTGQGIIRPLLEATRDEILDYLGRCGLSFREDASNSEDFCQRNFLRLRIFPLLAERFHGKAPQVLGRHADLARDEEDYWRAQVEANWGAIDKEPCGAPPACLEEGGGRIVLDCEALGALHPALQRRMLRSAVEKLLGNLQGVYSIHVDMLRELYAATETSPSDVIHLPHRMRAHREGNSLILSTAAASAMEEDLAPFLVAAPGVHQARDFTLLIHVHERPRRVEDFRERPAQASSRGAVCIYAMDADRISWPLTVRPWEPGDRFRPLGLRGSKKLQDFFTDSKIPRSEKRRIPLLCDREKICAVLGWRLDDRVKIGAETVQVLVVEYARNPSETPAK